MLLSLLSAALLLAAPGCEDSPVTQLQEPDLTLEWTGRYKTTLRNYTWASFRDMSGTRYDDAVADYANGGYILINTGATVTGRGVRYSQVWRENAESRRWDQGRDLNFASYGIRRANLEEDGYRPLDVEAWEDGGVQKFAGVWIDNLEGISFRSRVDMTSSEYSAFFQEQRDAGRRPVDIEIYNTSDGVRLAAIWYENVGNRAWVQRRDMSRTAYESAVEELNATGFKMIDFESYRMSGTQYYAAIWVQPEEGYASQVRTDRTGLQYGNLWRQYRDEGYRPLAVEQYRAGGGEVRFGGIWAESDDRFRFPDRSALNQAVSDYQQNQGPSGEIPGLSVAIIRNGDMVYRRGFGQADVAGGKVAHGGTVYLAASVSKVIGATLAARLEAEGRLRDGTTVNLDLADPTSDYLPGLPSWHNHTLEQLASHTACVPHYACGANLGGYCTYPGIANATLAANHYATAQAAAADVWGAPLIDSIWDGSDISNGCSVGGNRRYSTHAFTLLGAAMEAASGRPLDDLVDSELRRQFGLGSLRVMFADPTLPGDFDRAVPYDNSGSAIQYADNSWKVFGGGIEITAVDMARFGWKVLSGEIVDATTRDTRLLAPVNCAGRGGGICFNGLGWQLDTDGSGRTIAEHGGSWVGARSHLRLYEDDGLVIAVMSNQTGHNPAALVEQLGDIILP